MGLPINGLDRQAFLEHVVGGNDARLSLCPGIDLLPLDAGKRRGLALQIAREALQAGQLQAVLERRYEYAQAFDGCFVYLDASGALVVWHALPASPAGPGPLDHIISQILSLARLDALDIRHDR